MKRAGRSPLTFALPLWCAVAGLVEVVALGKYAGALVSLALGLWTMAGVLWLLVERTVLRLAFGPDAELRLRSALLAAWSGRWRRGSPRSLAAVFVAPGLLLAWVLWARAIVSHAHHPGWIALAIVAGELGLAGLFAIAWQILARLLSRLPWVPSARQVWLGAAALGAGVLADVFVRFWEELEVVGAPPLLLAAAVLFLAHATVLAVGLRAPRPPWFALALLFALSLAAVVWGEQSSVARAALRASPYTASYLRTGLGRLADWDGDGVEAFPFGDDCAPLDARVRPLALEIPGNGLDENCDGSDEAPSQGQNHGDPQPLTSERPDLVLITVDALRADHMGFMGYRRKPTSPELDELARRGVVFEQAFSQDSGTGPSFTALMTGKTPFQVDLRDASHFPPGIGPGEHTLAELLSAGGYRAEAQLCGDLFTVPTWGIQRGFATFREVCGPRRQRQAEVVARAAEGALRRQQAAPLFLWVHFFDPHGPYVDHPQLHFGSSPMDRYDEEIRYAQHYIAEVIRRALAPERGRPTFVVLTADHGENFGEHGIEPHARTLYREVTHVPLVVWGPGIEPRRVGALVAQSDVYPTMLDLAAVRTPASCSMTSFVHLLSGDPESPGRVVFQENSWSRPRRHVKALVRGRYHYIRDLSSRTSALYDMTDDPREQHDLAGQGLAVEPALGAAMDAFVPTTHLPPELR